MFARKCLYLTLCLAALNNLPTAQANEAMQVPCAARADLVRMLDAKYGEKLANTGVTAVGHLVEVYVSNRGTWTILASRPTGLSCIISAGQSWEGQIIGKNLTAL